MVELLPTAPISTQFSLKVVFNSCHMSTFAQIKKTCVSYRLANIGGIRSVNVPHASRSMFLSYLNTICTN